MCCTHEYFFCSRLGTIVSKSSNSLRIKSIFSYVLFALLFTISDFSLVLSIMSRIRFSKITASTQCIVNVFSKVRFLHLSEFNAASALADCALFP